MDSFISSSPAVPSARQPHAWHCRVHSVFSPIPNQKRTTLAPGGIPGTASSLLTGASCTPHIGPVWADLARLLTVGIVVHTMGCASPGQSMLLPVRGIAGPQNTA